MSEAQQELEMQMVPRPAPKRDAASKSSRMATGVECVGNMWRSGTANRPISEKVMRKHIDASQEWKGTSTFGLRPSSEIMNEFVQSREFAERAPLTMALPNRGNVCKNRLSKRRQKDRACEDVHPGFCKLVDSDNLPRAKRLHRSLFDAMSSKSTPLGSALFVMTGVGADMGPGLKAQLVIPSFQLSNPKRMLLALVDSDELRPFRPGRGGLSIARPFGARLRTPVVFQDLWQYTRVLIEEQPNVHSWRVCALEYESKADCLCTFIVRGLGSCSQVSSLPQPKAEVDPLDAAIRAVTHPKKPTRRCRRKMKTSSAAGSTGADATDESFEEDDAESSDSHTSIASEEPPPGPAKSAPVKTSSFFHREDDLGVRRIEFSYTRASRCMTCGHQIQKGGPPRLVYAYHTRRPHAYIHLKCCLSLEDKFVSGAEAVLSAVSDTASHSMLVLETLAGLRRKLKSQSAAT